MLEHRLSRCCAFSISFARLFGCGDNYGRSFVSLQQKAKKKCVVCNLPITFGLIPRLVKLLANCGAKSDSADKLNNSPNAWMQQSRAIANAFKDLSISVPNSI